MLTRLALGALLLMSTGCGDDRVGGPLYEACTAIFAYGLSIDVTDAVTGAPLEGVSAEVRDGDFVDPYVSVFGSTVVGAGERAGVYTVVIRKEGYRDWTRSGIVVTADRCHVMGVHLDAALEPVR
jgi:hypothetical protein